MPYSVTAPDGRIFNFPTEDAANQFKNSIQPDSVTVPDGRVFNFPTKLQADKFRQQFNIATPKVDTETLVPSSEPKPEPKPEPVDGGQEEKSILSNVGDVFSGAFDYLKEFATSGKTPTFGNLLQFGFSDKYTKELAPAPDAKGTLDPESETERAYDSFIKAAKQMGLSGSLILEQAGLVEPETTEKMRTAYNETSSDPRVADMIKYSNEMAAADPEASDTKKGFIAAKSMLKYVVENPMAGVNLLVEQAPAFIASLPVARISQLGVVGISKLLKASPQLASRLGLAGFGASSASTSVVLGSLGANYEEGMQKFDGDTEKATEYATTKTANEVGPNAIASMFLAIGPSSFPALRQTMPKTAVLGDVVLQSGAQATGAVIGAKRAAESVGEEASPGELAAEALFDLAFTPIEFSLARKEITEQQARNKAYDSFVNQFDEGVLSVEDKTSVRDLIDNRREEKQTFADIEKELKIVGLEKLQSELGEEITPSVARKIVFPPTKPDALKTDVEKNQEVDSGLVKMFEDRLAEIDAKEPDPQQNAQAKNDLVQMFEAKYAETKATPTVSPVAPVSPLEINAIKVDKLINGSNVKLPTLDVAKPEIGTVLKEETKKAIAKTPKDLTELGKKATPEEIAEAESLIDEFNYFEDTFGGLSREEKRSIFGRAARILSSEKFKGTEAEKSAQQVLDRATEFQKKIAYEDASTVDNNLLESLQQDPDPFNYNSDAVAIQGHVIPDRLDLRPETDLLRRLNKLEEQFSRGFLTSDDYASEIQSLVYKANLLRDRRKGELSTKPRVRGAAFIKEKLNNAVRNQAISPKTAELFEWVINQNPSVADKLGVSIVKVPEGKQAGGDYNPMNRVMRIFKGSVDPQTAVHELMHHMERMMPSDVQNELRKLWLKELTKYIKQQEDAIKLSESSGAPIGFVDRQKLKLMALREIELANISGVYEGHFQAREAFNRNSEFWNKKKIKMGMQPDGVPVLNSSEYQFLNPSEFWAVNAADILNKRFDTKDSTIRKIKQWIAEFVQRVMDVLKLPNNYPLYRTINDLLSGKISAKPKGDMTLALTTSGEFDSLFNNEETKDSIGRGIDNAKQGLLDEISGRLTTKNALEVKSIPKKALLGAMDTFNIFDLMEKSNIKFLGDLANTAEGLLSNLRTEQQRLTQYAAEKLKPFARFVNESSIGGELLMDMMSLATAIRFDPSLHADTATALKNDYGLNILRKRMRGGELTTAEIDSAEIIFGPNWDKQDPNKAFQERVRAINSIKRDWQTLGKIKRAPSEASKIINADQPKPYIGEAHDIYKSIKQAYQEISKLNEKLQLAEVEKLGLGDEAKALLVSNLQRMFNRARSNPPYFPLMRFGDFWLRVSPESEFYTARVFETAKERNDFEAELRQDMAEAGEDPGMYITTGDSRDSFKREIGSSAEFLQELFNQLDALQSEGGISPEQLNEVKDQFIDLYLSSLPDRDLRTRLLRRKVVPGYSKDQIRTFATYMGSASAQLPRLAIRRDMRQAVENAEESLKVLDFEKRQQVAPIVNEVKERMDLQLSPRPQDELAQQAESILSQAVFYRFLTGVDTALQNYSVLTTFAPVVLGERFGYATTAKTLTQFLTGALNATSTVEDMGLSPKDVQDLSQPIAPIENFSLYNTALVQNNPILQKAYERFNNQSGFNQAYLGELIQYRTQASEKAVRQESGEVGEAQRLLNLVSLPFRVTERQVREIVYLSAFKMAWDNATKNVQAGDTEALNQAFEKAVTEARKLTKEAAFDYDPANRNFNRIVNNNIPFLSWLTRQGTRLQSFKFQALGFMLKNLSVGIGLTRNLPVRERVRALEKLAGITIMSMFTGGFQAAFGSWLVFYLVTKAVQQALDSAEDEGDNEFVRQVKEDELYREDMSLWFQNKFIPQHFGKDTFFSRFIEGGALNAVTGYDFGSKLSLDFASPNLFKRRASTIEAQVGSAVVDMFGVAADVGMGAYETSSEAIKALANGNIAEAMYVIGRDASLSISPVKDVVTAVQEKTEGVRAKASAGILPSEISGLDTVLRAAGFKTANRATMDRLALKEERAYNAIQQERSDLRKEYKQAYIEKEEGITGAQEKLDRIEKEIAAFNKRYDFESNYPESEQRFRITGKDMMQAEEEAKEALTRRYFRSRPKEEGTRRESLLRSSRPAQ